jgi:hypothetical protein
MVCALAWEWVVRGGLLVCALAALCSASGALAQITAGADQAGLRAMGEAALKYQLLDPYSAVIEWSPGPFVPVTSITKGGGIFKRTVVSGPALVGCGTVNAKNRMGGYVGRQAFDVAFQDGKVVLAEMDSDGDPYPATAQFCRSLGF